MSFSQHHSDGGSHHLKDEPSETENVPATESSDQQLTPGLNT